MSGGRWVVRAGAKNREQLTFDGVGERRVQGVEQNGRMRSRLALFDGWVVSPSETVFLSLYDTG